MIIGLCGLIGSGKNTVAEHLLEEHAYESISFAETLKDAAAAIFGWNRVMLEGATPEAREAREKISDEELFQRSLYLLSRYLPEFSVTPVSVTWRPMNERWGSCTSVDRTIRLATKLQRAPKYVLDFVLYHEAIHLQHADHGPEFYEFLHRYPRHLEAEAFLAGYEMADNQ